MATRPIGLADLKELVARGADLTLRIPVGNLARLAALAPPGDGSPADLIARLAFGRGGDGRPRLELTVDGPVPLVCQRCLGPMVLPLHLTAGLTVVSSDQEARDLAEPFEAVVTTDEGLDPTTVIEDEVLAALPLAPVHGDGRDCVAPRDVGSDSQPGRYRPLAGLGGLLGRTPRRTGD